MNRWPTSPSVTSWWQAGGTMQNIVGSIDDLSQIVRQIASTSTQQAGGIEQVNQAIAAMDDVTQQNAALVEQTAAAAQSLSDQGEILQRAINVFTIDVGAARRGARVSSSRALIAS